MSTYGLQNLTFGVVSGSFTDSQTSLSLQSGHGSRFDDGVFPERAILWNFTDYADPAEAYWAGAAEIVELQAKSGDSLSTIVRAREGTSGVASVAGRTYRIAVVATQAALLGLQNIPYVLIEDQRTQNTQGGTYTAGAWQTRVLNTIVSDVAGLVISLSSNQVELAPGDWLIRASAPANSIGRSQIRLQDLTSGAPGTQLKAGTSEATSGAGLDTTRAFLTHRLTFSANKKFEIQMQGAATVATFGAGSAANFTTEVYAVFEAFKLGNA